MFGNEGENHRLQRQRGMPLPAGVKAGKGTLYTPVPTSLPAEKGTIGLLTDPAVVSQSLLLTCLKHSQSVAPGIAKILYK